MKENEELRIYKKFKEELICPKCQKQLVCKEYEINQKTILLALSCILLGIIITICFVI